MLTNNLILLVSKKQIYYISVWINIFDEIKTKILIVQVNCDFLRMVKILEDAKYFALNTQRIISKLYKELLVKHSQRKDS